MDRVYSLQERPLRNIGIVAIVIHRHDDGGHHVGVLHRDGAAALVQVLHLEWHHRLKNDDPRDYWHLWVDVGLHPKRAVQVALQCRQIAKSNGQFVPYAFTLPKNCFDSKTGAWLLSQSGQGLTCATLVIAVFSAAGLPLLKPDTWVSRPSDADWHRKMIELAKMTGCPPDHLAALESQVGVVRFRPCEVAAAGALSPPPSDFDAAASLGQQIENRLSRDFGAESPSAPSPPKGTAKAPSNSPSQPDLQSVVPPPQASDL